MPVVKSHDSPLKEPLVLTHFPEWKAEAQRSRLISPRSHRWEMLESGFEPRPVGSKSNTVNLHHPPSTALYAVSPPKKWGPPLPPPPSFSCQETTISKVWDPLLTALSSAASSAGLDPAINAQGSKNGCLIDLEAPPMSSSGTHPRGTPT